MKAAIAAMRRKIIGFLASAMLMAPAAAEAPALPKPGLVVDWRQTAQGALRGEVRQEIAAVNGPIVSYRESVRAADSAATEFETWRGLVLIKRRVPQSAAFVESTLSFTLDIQALEALMPPAPGRNARLEVKGRSAQRLGVTATAPFLTADVAGILTVTVERRETILVPAGRFATIVIRSETTLEEVGMGSRATVSARIWFAPALGWPVKKHQLTASGAVDAEALALKVTQPR